MELWIGALVAASIVFLGLWLLTLRERRERTLARALGQGGTEDAYEGAAQPRVFGRWLEQTATRMAGPEGLGQAAQQLRWAGLNLGDALGHVADRMGGLLGREIRRAGEEMRLGAPRAQALLSVADRVGHDGLTRALQEVTQAEKTGTPVVRTLRQQGQVLRDERRLRAQELAQKSSLKLMAPVILLIFLPTMVLILSPAVINILNVLR